MNNSFNTFQIINDYISDIFDDDIKFDEEVAEDGTVISPGVAKVQFKQLLGVGLLYSF